MERQKFNPKRGEVYRHHNPHNSSYVCLHESQTRGRATLRCVASGWTFVAHGCGVYPDGTIDWNFSSGGYFSKEDS